ncbi:lysozyme inhibitor [Pseudomonas capeferrum]|uniref:MliC family protein n=1 Tax=Pseudomonas capeferrum TaxID=1495066 RepID=UPI0015E34FEB|nr:MliC family protein [Pseudomonas capeferrum]MBA1202928.1 lysozyme inhibitor [Pseudomonas capeferrum]
MRALMAGLALAVLAGCTGLRSTSPAPSADWTRWVCDSGAELAWRLADANGDTVEVRLGAGDRVYRLASEPGASGSLYGDGVLAFHVQGEEGLAYWVATNDLIGRGCKAP